MRALVLLLASLLAAPALGQSRPPAPNTSTAAPRWYLSAQAGYQRFHGLSAGPDVRAGSLTTLAGPLVQAGWRASARTALALGVSVGYQGWHQAYRYGYFIPEVCPYWQVRTVTVALPLQVQSQLLEPGARWGLEAQAGVVWVRRYSEVEELGDFCEPLPSAPVARGFQASATDLPALLGLGLTRRLGPHWQAVAQAQAAFSFRYLFDRYGGSFEEARPGGGGSLGLRYDW